MVAIHCDKIYLQPLAMPKCQHCSQGTHDTGSVFGTPLATRTWGTEDTLKKIKNNK